MSVKSDSPYSGERFLVAHLLDPKWQSGDTFEEWPLHITLLPWFHGMSSDITARFGVVLEDIRACRVALGARSLGAVALYGDEEDVPVRPILDSTALGVMHGILLAQFHRDLENRTYIGGHYNPHLTIRENADPGEAAEVSVDSLGLVRHDGTHKTVVFAAKLMP